jgi:hypothetical protein
MDVDLEDRLVYGLTPMRLAYFVLALLAGTALWSSHWAPAPLRGCACAIVMAAGSVLAWGSWRGRPADAWVADLAIFVAACYRVRWHRDSAVGHARGAAPHVDIDVGSP